mgnify:CR=1 FL=1
MSKKIFKDRAVMRKRMVLALGFIVAIFGLLIVRLSYVMIVKEMIIQVGQKNNGLVKLELMPEEVEY